MECPDCSRTFRSKWGVQAHRYQAHGWTKSEAEKREAARAREARYRARHPERRRQQVRAAIARLPPDYFRVWRQNNADSERARRKRWRKANPDLRNAQQRRYRERRRGEPLVPLYPHLRQGTRVSFWEDELRMDLEQERQLAILEGRDPKQAVARYRGKEIGWKRITAPLIEM